MKKAINILLLLIFIIMIAQTVILVVFINSQTSFNNDTAEQVVKNRLILEDYIHKNDLRNLCEKPENSGEKICQDKDYLEDLLKTDEENHFTDLKQ